MSQRQHDYFLGLITIKVKGKLIEPFLQACVRNGCHITNVRRINPEVIQMTIRLKDWSTCRKLRKNYQCKFKVVSRKGIPFLFQHMLKRTSLAAAFILGVLLVFLLANTLWSIHVEGLNPELRASVEKQLKSYGVAPGKLTIGMDDPNEIQRKLLDDVPDLLWIGVKKQGTSYHLYGVEKTRQDKNVNTHPADLIAVKKGMVIKTFIKKGRPLVSVYDVVKKGQRLASGKLVEGKDNNAVVRAEGEVIAETWYKASLSVPVKQQLKLTNGDAEKEYQLQFGKISIPIWGWWHKQDQQKRAENYVSDWSVLKWKLPVHLSTTYYYHSEDQANSYSNKEAVSRGTETAKQSLFQQLPKDSKIIEEKVLHESEENGKVKLILLFKVYENIAATRNY
ncbi:sporulation protein YqfD [Halobacillus salinarum]|uniref:Sporulation protein YqfD n=1 Tax=Halobacillus salinarum TaxID=2932257 RepID=A0ABY4EQ94_9BACI|nr:sporulation protein YqfD [Halobacillus salinarum]UOQ46348.1 sporulation protein YqfD [Halobacillus salinarum]